jgi:Rod binding domain-containing protein
MDIQLNHLNPDTISSLKNAKGPEKKEEMAMAFEKLFARQLVQEMTKGLFKSDDKKPMMGAGNGMYRDHIVDTLSQELAEQKKLGMADMITRYVDDKNNI